MALAERWLLRFFLPALARRCDSSNNSLLGFDSPTRYLSETFAFDLDLSVKTVAGNSHGVSIPLQRSRKQESTSDQVSLGGSLALCSGQASASESHLADYGAALRFFQPFSGILPLTTLLPFSDRWRSWGLPYRELLLPRSSNVSSTLTCPLDVAPLGCAAPILGGSTFGPASRYLGCAGTHLFRLQGLDHRENRHHHKHV